MPLTINTNIASLDAQRNLNMSQGSLAIFFTRPIAGAITGVALLFFALPLLTPGWRRLRGTGAPSPHA